MSLERNIIFVLLYNASMPHSLPRMCYFAVSVANTCCSSMSHSGGYEIAVQQAYRRIVHIHAERIATIT